MCEKNETSTLTPFKHDPYKEFEIYLQKAQNEIGQIFQDAGPTKANEHVTAMTSGACDVISPPPPSTSAWIHAKRPDRGVKVLAQLEALLHGLSRSQMDSRTPRYTAPPTQKRGREHSAPPAGLEMVASESRTPVRVEKVARTHERASSRERREENEGYVTDAANMDALTAWVENLVDEMNSIGDEEKVKDRKRETLVRWLLSDLSDSNGTKTVNGSSDSDSRVVDDESTAKSNASDNENVVARKQTRDDEKQATNQLPETSFQEVGARAAFLMESRKDSESHVSRLSSTTSTLSSTGSQMKPEDVQDFLRRVETSIWESESLKRRKKLEEEDAKVDETIDDFDTFLSDVGTQTTPCLSRTCSTLLEENEVQDSISCSSIDVLSTLSVPSSFGEETVEAKETPKSNETKGAVKIMGIDTKGYAKLAVSEEDVWVRREHVESQTKVESNDVCAPDESSESPTCETPSPQIVRETKSDTNISKSKKCLVLRAPLSAPTSAAPSPMSETGPNSPSTGPASKCPSSVLDIFNIAPKSSSAPVLDARNLSLPIDGDKIDGESNPSPSSPTLSDKVIPRLRSQSVKELTELEAVEACNWLRAAGFPQYAQMFEDSQFPINIAAVQKDHYFLDADSLQSLFRRLNTLNKCARMRLDNIPRKSAVEDSDDDEQQCALSENWTFQRQSRRWSRIPMCLDPCVSHSTAPQALNNGHKSRVDCGGVEVPAAMDEGESAGVVSPTPDTPPPDGRCSAFKRSGSDRLKDGARAFLRRMESFKTRHSKRRNREAVVISGPQVMDTDGMEQRVHQLSCVDLTPSPQLIHRMNVARNRSVSQTDDSSPNSVSDNNSSQSSTPSSRARRGDGSGRSPSEPRSDSGGPSDPECSPPTLRPHVNVRTGSFHLSHQRREENKEKKCVSERKSNCHVGTQHDSDSGSNMSTNPDVDGHKSDSNGRILIDHNRSRKTSVISYRSSFSSNSLSVNALSVGQLMILRKLALLKLTALMERYSPSNRSGWSWMMPKFIKRMKNPDYKDKVVFGVPLSVVHQRTGQPLPPSIQAAIRFLKKNAVDAVGIFRKSGVRSRILKLKNMCEANPINISYEGQQTYDVADMLKQYFRELPEALLTNKMSETFIAIYQCIPEELRLEALQAAVLLIPDENREILQKLLSFLYDTSLQAQENQMTASNLAVCFAPSLFHMNTCRGSSNSPRRRKTVGVPDQKELNENRAAHDCLSFMIREHKNIFSVSEDAVFQCRVSYVDDTEPFSVDEMTSLNGFDNGNWKNYVHVCIQNLMKECREKVKGWINMTTHENAELAFKKVGDGNPLRMWKVSVQVEAPPVELLNRVLRERHLWDEQLVKWRVVYKVDSSTEVFNYVCDSMSPLPARDYCILRSWRTDLAKGACVLVESSVNLSESPLLLGNVRGVVMFSRYLIEPCGSGKSRITHISRIDTRGRSPEWYNRVYGHICALHLLRLGNSFRHNAEGPESKV